MRAEAETLLSPLAEALSSYDDIDQALAVYNAARQPGPTGFGDRSDSFGAPPILYGSGWRGYVCL
jgi:hypothetical protein